jgi:hypothetical protein
MGYKDAYYWDLMETVRVQNLLSEPKDLPICATFGCRHVLTLEERRCGNLCLQCLHERKLGSGHNFRNDPIFLDEIFANFYDEF